MHAEVYQYSAAYQCNHVVCEVQGLSGLEYQRPTYDASAHRRRHRALLVQCHAIQQVQNCMKDPLTHDNITRSERDDLLKAHCHYVWLWERFEPM